MGWFDIAQIADHVYAISEPHHWEQVRSYLFVGTDSALLVDTGIGIVPIKPTVDAITDLPTRVILTHCHWDHIGSVNSFDDVYIHPLDAAWLRNGLPLPAEAVRETLVSEGYDASLCPGFEPSRYTIPTRDAFTTTEDGARFTNGRHCLEVLHTPGHSPGSICLFERKLGLLVTGDTVYRGTIYANYPSTSPTDLLESYRKLDARKAKYVLPGHNDNCATSELIREGRDLLEKLQVEGRLKHGTGLHGERTVSFHL